MIRAILILITAVLVTAGDIPAQPVEWWVSRYDGPAQSSDAAREIAMDNEGNVYVTGRTSMLGFLDIQYHTIKYNAVGQEVWSANYGGTVPNSTASAGNIAVDAEHNVYVTGWINWTDGESADIATLKYDPAGNPLWADVYDGPAGGNDLAWDMALDSQGNILVVGYTSTADTILNSTQFIVIKYNPDGVRRWTATYGNNARATAVAVDETGNVYATGSVSSAQTQTDYATVKYDSQGVFQWEAIYDGPGRMFDDAVDLGVDHEGNVYVTGTSAQADLDVACTTIKYDNQGQPQWVNTYDGPADSIDVPTALVVCNYGGVVITGGSYGVGTLYDCLTIKYTSGGQQEWASRYDGPSHGQDYGRDIELDRFDTPVVCGSTEGWGNFIPGDYLMIKYQWDGSWYWITTYDGPANYSDEALAVAVSQNSLEYAVTGQSMSSIFVPPQNYDYATVKYYEPDGLIPEPGSGTTPEEFALYPAHPNPFNATTAITYNLRVGSYAILHVFDTSGRLISTLVGGWQQAGTHQVYFDGSKLSTGLYFIRLQAGEFTASTKTLLLK